MALSRGYCTTQASPADQHTAGNRACRVAGGGGGIGVVQPKADGPHVHREGAQQGRHAAQLSQAVLAPGDPSHPPPRHSPNTRVFR